MNILTVDLIADDNQAEKLYVVEEVIGKKMENGITYYLLKWAGWSAEYNSWEPEENLIGIQELIEEFNQKNAERLSVHPRQDITDSIPGILPTETSNLTNTSKKNTPVEMNQVSCEEKQLISQLPKIISEQPIPNVMKQPMISFQEKLKIELQNLNLPEGSFKSGDIPEQILAVDVVGAFANGEKMVNCLVKWRKRDNDQMLRPSIYTNTIVKQRCPELLIAFYESKLKIADGTDQSAVESA